MKSNWIKLIQFFTENMFITNFIILSVLFFGFYINQQIKREVAPQVEADAIHINIYHPTASAQEIEQDIIVPLEETLQGFDVSMRYTSFANDSYGKITASLPITKDIVNTRQRLIASLQNIPNLPPEARITITEEGAQSIPMYYFSLQSVNGISNQTTLLQQEAQNLIKKITRISNVYTVETSGLLQKEIFVHVNPNKLIQYYLSLQEIVRSLFRRNINNSEGILNVNNSEKILVTDAGFRYPLDITNTIIRSNFEKKSVSIDDIASVSEGFEQANNDTFINNTLGVFFGVRSKNGANITILTKELDQLITEYKKNLPLGLEITIVDKRADSVNTILKFTQFSALISIFIVFFVLLLFLDPKTAFWTTISIPITISLLMIALYYSNISMNIITLCGIITALGMLVDHGIIISENIYRYRKLGYNSIDTIYHGVGEVFQPILVTVLTTIVAFIPLLLIRDTIGNLIKPLPIVISIALIFSFVDAVLFLPTHLAHVPLPPEDKKNHQIFERLKEFYGKVLKKVLHFRYLVLCGFIGLLFGTLVLINHMFKGFVFMEPIGVSSLYVNLEAPSSINRKQMKKIVNELTELVKTVVPEYERTIIKEEIGKNHILAFSSKGFAPNKGQIAIYLTPIEERTREYDQILSSIQQVIDRSPQATNFTRIFYDSFGLIPKTEASLKVQFLQGLGSETQSYIIAMQEVFEYISSLGGVINPEHSTLTGKNKLILEFDYVKMAQLGIDPSIVSETLKIAVSGIIPTTWRSYQEKIPYIVRLDDPSRNSIEELQELLIPNLFNRLIPLKTFTSVAETSGKEDILRSYGQRMVEIYVNVDPHKTTPTTISKLVEDFYDTIKYKYPDVDLQTGGESVIISKAFEDFKLAFVIAGILIYIILLLLFKEPLQPFIVLIAVPFGIIGSVWAFYFHNQVLSFMSLVGIVGLSGIVVNDAIVMVDFINKVVHNNTDPALIIPSIVEGAQNRLKAILLTTITTVAGLLPSIYGLKGVADLIIPITTAIAYGLIFATILTPFFIPVLYLVSFDIKQKFLQIYTKYNNKSTDTSI
ncbi:MAG: efflux RND transporter permease subunit [Brevinema sp.]